MGEFVTHATVWVAVLLYGLSTCSLLLKRPPSESRLLWTLGLGIFIVHVCTAFHFFYDWSHQTAWLETARITEDFVGRHDGTGIYLNYLFTAVWAIDCVWWWMAGLERYTKRRIWISLTIHLFFLFMIINGGIVFVEGPVRWFTTAVVAAVLICAAARKLAPLTDERDSIS